MSNKKLTVTFCSFPDFASSVRPLYNYMKKRYKNKMNLVWVVRTDETYQKLQKENIEVYKLHSKEYYNFIKKTNVIITSHGDLIADKPKGCLYLELWHGIGSKKAGYLVDNLNETDDNWMKLFSQKVDYMVIPNEFWATVFSSIFYLERKRFLTLGYPKFDEFILKNPEKKLSRVLGIDVTKFSKIILYTPTFKKGCGRDEKISFTENLIDLKKYDENKLIKYLENNNYLLCIKKHPSEELDTVESSSPNIKMIKDSVLTELDISVNEILNAADCLISDYSSLGTEFVFLNKPVILLSTNNDTFNDSRGLVFDNFSFWTTGFSANTIENLIENLNKALNEFNPNAEYYKIKRELWFSNLKDGGCKQICDFIFEDNHISSKVQYYHSFQDDIDNLKTIILNKEKELNMVYNSRGWKLLEKLRKIKRGNRK